MCERDKSHSKWTVQAYLFVDLHPGLKLSYFVAVEIKNINLKFQKLELVLEFS